MQVIILGWDALDAALIEKYGLEDAFGRPERIETYANPVIDKPHTRELWPSMITGTSPDEHGIHAISKSDGVEWDAEWLNQLSNLATGVVPKPVRNAIGRQLRERGAALDAKRPRYYHKHGLETVFDREGRAISIPNYETEHDRKHGLDGNRDDVWAAILPERDGTAGFDPAVGLPGVASTLGSAAGDRVGHTLAAIEQGHSLVWTWFGLLDTVGHVDPAMNADLERLGYGIAARATETIRDAAPEDSVVVCVSDHGLQDGEHTHYATLATDDAPTHERIEHVFDVHDWVQATRGQRRPADQGYGDGVEKMTEQLESLGYIES